MWTLLRPGCSYCIETQPQASTRHTSHPLADAVLVSAHKHAHVVAGKNVDSPETWLQLLHWDPALKLAPAVASTLLLMLVMGRFKSPWALPVVLIFIPGVFFIVLLGMHKSLEDAQDSGWVAKPQVSMSPTRLLLLLDQSAL